MARTNISASIGGKTISGTLTRTEATDVSSQVTVSAAKAGTLSTRTDNDTGTLTLASGHGITNAQVIDIYWSGGIQRGCVVGTVSGTSVPFDSGAGDNLPIATTAITACVQVVVDTDVAAATIEMAAASATRKGSVQFQQSNGTAILSLGLGVASGTAGEAWSWASGVGVSTPFGADVGKVAISNGDSSNSNIISFGLVSDNDV